MRAVLEMSNSREPDGGAKGSSGWEERQGLVPNETLQGASGAPSSLPRLSESPRKAGDPDAAADSLAASHRRHSLGGAAAAAGAPRAPRFSFGRSRSLQEGSEHASSSRAPRGRTIFGGWRINGGYSALKDQVLPVSSMLQDMRWALLPAVAPVSLA